MALLSYSIFSQTNDEQFNSFFQQFKSAVKNNNVAEIAGLTNFPLYGNGAAVKQINTLVKKNLSLSRIFLIIKFWKKQNFTKQ